MSHFCEEELGTLIPFVKPIDLTLLVHELEGRVQDIQVFTTFLPFLLLHVSVQGIEMKLILYCLQIGFTCGKLLINVFEATVVKMFQWPSHSFEQSRKLTHFCTHRHVPNGFCNNGFKPIIFTPHIAKLK